MLKILFNLGMILGIPALVVFVTGIIMYNIIVGIGKF